jgi:hypothetical protein
MGVSNAISAQGTIIKLNGTEVAELRDITPPQLTRKVIDTTSHNADYDTAVVGIKRRSELQFEIGFVHDIHESILNAYDAGSLDLWQILYPDGATWSFSGYVTLIGPKQPVDNGQTANINVRPTNDHVITIPA